MDTPPASVASAADLEKIARFNRTEAPFPNDATLQVLIEAQVARNASATAVICDHDPVFGASSLTFAALNEKANPGLLGIGATYEGTFRNHMVMPGGRLRHSTYYSVIVDEWPEVKARLQAKLARPSHGSMSRNYAW